MKKTFPILVALVLMFGVTAFAFRFNDLQIDNDADIGGDLAVEGNLSAAQASYDNISGVNLDLSGDANVDGDGTFGSSTTISLSNGTMAPSTSAYTLTADGNFYSDGDISFQGDGTFGSSTTISLSNGTMTPSTSAYTLTADGNFDTDGTLDVGGVVTFENATSIFAFPGGGTGLFQPYSSATEGWMIKGVRQ